MFRGYGNLLALLFDTHEPSALRSQLSGNLGTATSKIDIPTVETM
jgi:hypothetical protein